jgi:uncharacterized protein (DUF305 family)
MTSSSFSRRLSASAAIVLGAWSSSAHAQATASATTAAAIEKARADSLRYPYSDGDVRFMSGMIGHHAQAIVMSRMVMTHGADPAVVRLAERIINAQQDEIAIMQRWLADRQKPVPDATPMNHATMDHSTMTHGAKSDSAAKPTATSHEGMNHSTIMPGMLSDAQMAALDAARGFEFDRLFLTGMIQHHRGATAMVKELFETPGAGQDETIFKFASDVNVDQTTEIARMQRMLFEFELKRAEAP